MKKVSIFVILFYFIFNQTFAQTEKGTWLLGGNGSYQSIKDNSFLYLSPNIGYFAGNNFAIGMNAALGVGTDVTQTSFGPFLRPYFGNSNKGSFFAQFGGVFENTSFKSSSYQYSISSRALSFGLGYAVFLNKSAALEIGASYLNIENVDNDRFGINVGFQIHFNKESANGK
jgi:hypothetical protein